MRIVVCLSWSIWPCDELSRPYYPENGEIDFTVHHIINHLLNFYIKMAAFCYIFIHYTFSSLKKQDLYFSNKQVLFGGNSKFEI